MSFTVFYAWQSDRAQRDCRYFIRDAAKQAVKQLAKDAVFQAAPSLDHDTKGEPGTPHVARSIEKKIRRCGVFIADVTFVTSYRSCDGRRKLAPNPNVMIELGTAIRSVGWERILLVMNTDYGRPEHLPFDLKHHSFPMQYSLKEGDRNLVSKELTKHLTEKLIAIAKAGVIEASALRRLPVIVTIKCVKDDREGNEHVRWLLVDIVNRGDDLNGVHAVLEYPAAKGQAEFQVRSVGEVPNPFKRGFSCRFSIPQEDPSQAIAVLKDVDPSLIAVVIRSRVREVARVPASRWLKELDAFRNPDPTMPLKPPERPQRRLERIDVGQWLRARPNWLDTYRDRH